MPVTFSPIVAPSPGTQVDNALALRKAPFGDGYTQVSPAGLNHIRRVVTLKWDALTLAEARSIEDFFRSRGGTIPFLYTVRGDASPSQWTCEKWSRSDATPCAVTATLEENFTPDP